MLLAKSPNNTLPPIGGGGSGRTSHERAEVEVRVVMKRLSDLLRDKRAEQMIVVLDAIVVVFAREEAGRVAHVETRGALRRRPCASRGKRRSGTGE